MPRSAAPKVRQRPNSPARAKALRVVVSQISGRK